MATPVATTTSQEASVSQGKEKGEGTARASASASASASACAQQKGLGEESEKKYVDKARKRASFISRRCKVHWKEDDAFYSGVVADLRVEARFQREEEEVAAAAAGAGAAAAGRERKKKKRLSEVKPGLAICVKYDDGDVEWLEIGKGAKIENDEVVISESKRLDNYWDSKSEIFKSGEDFDVPEDLEKRREEVEREFYDFYVHKAREKKEEQERKKAEKLSKAAPKRAILLEDDAGAQAQMLDRKKRKLGKQDSLSKAKAVLLQDAAAAQGEKKSFLKPHSKKPNPISLHTQSQSQGSGAQKKPGGVLSRGKGDQSLAQTVKEAKENSQAAIHLQRLANPVFKECYDFLVRNFEKPVFKKCFDTLVRTFKTNDSNMHATFQECCDVFGASLDANGNSSSASQSAFTKEDWRDWQTWRNVFEKGDQYWDGKEADISRRLQKHTGRR